MIYIKFFNDNLLLFITNSTIFHFNTKWNRLLINILKHYFMTNKHIDRPNIFHKEYD